MKDNRLPESWESVCLGDIADITYGKGLPTKNLQLSGFPVFGANSIIGFYDRYLYEDSQLLISCRGAGSGTVNLSPPKCFVTNNSLVVSFPVEAKTLRKTFYYFLQAGKKEGLVTGSAQPQVTINNAVDLKLNLPPLNEQKRIVAKIEELFSELDNGIAALKTAREKLKLYRQAVLKHAFEGKLTAQWREENKDKLETPEQLLARIQKEREARYQQQLEEWKAAVKAWEEKGKEGKKPSKPKPVKVMNNVSYEEISILPVIPNEWRYTRLAEIAFIGSGISVSKDRKLNDPIEVPYLRVANVQRGCLMLNEIKTMFIERESLPDLALEKWDVLFNEGGDRDKLGRGWIWENQISPCITQNHVFRASPIIKSEYHAKFISYWGNSFGKSYFEKSGKQTTNLASINKTVLSNFPIPLSSLEEQQHIINMLGDIMSQIDAMDIEVENGIQRAETLRQSILKKAFSGQLVPQDPSDEPASELLARIQAGRESIKKKGSKRARTGK